MNMVKTIILTEKFQATDEDPFTITCIIANGSYVPITQLSSGFVNDRLNSEERQILSKYAKMEIPPSNENLKETANALKGMFKNDNYNAVLDSYVTKVSEGFKPANNKAPEPPKPKEKPKKEEPKKEEAVRPVTKLTDHLWVYSDDPAIVMVTLDGKATAARFTTNESLLHAGLVEEEMLAIAKYRKLMTQVEAGQEWSNENFYEIFPEIERAHGSLVPKESLVKRNETLANKQRDEQPPAPEEGQVRQKMVVQKGSELQLAKALGMPDELADLFFRKMDGKPYIMNPGLLFLANKKGKGAIQVEDSYDEKTSTWHAVTKIYPLISIQMIEALSKLDPSAQNKALDVLTQPTTGKGSANTTTVVNKNMHKFLREMAQTRSQNRALRAYTGYGDTSAEEMPTGVIDGDVQ